MLHEKNGGAASLPEMLLTVCLVILFGGTAVQELYGRAGAAQAQSSTAAAPGASAQKPASPTQAPPAPSAKPQTVAQKIAASQQLLDINTAAAAQLSALPGMGPAYAARVIQGRPYTAKNQLATRGVLPRDEYERIRDLIIAHRPKP